MVNDRGRLTRPPTVTREPAERADCKTPALAALLLIGWLAGLRGASRAKRRRAGTVCPAVTNTSVPDAPTTLARQTRRVRPGCGSSAVVPRVGSADLISAPRRNDRRTMCHLAPRWARMAPMV